METTNEIDIENLSDDQIMELLGACCLFGTNIEYINKQIKILEKKRKNY